MAAQEAGHKKDGNRLVTPVDIITVARRFCVRKWQKQWEQSDRGRKLLPKNRILHGPSMFVVKAKIYEVLYKQSSSIAFDETSSY